MNAKSGKAPTKPAAAEVKAKSAAKSVSVPVKAAAKAAAKTLAKPAAKAPPKPAVKAAAKPAAKPPAKAAAAAPAKPAAKAAAKTAAKVVAKPAAKVAVKAPAKAKAAAPTAAPVAAKPAKASAAPTASKAAVVSKVLAKPVALERVSAPMSPAATKPAPVPAALATPVVAQKGGRPSSRLAQLTVPSMAQAVASTAAKASYSQSLPTPVIVPALPSSIKKDPKLANNWKTKSVAELSDADLMAMPDSEYMNDVQLAAFRLKLIELKQGILNSAGETTEHLREDTSVVPDPADRATIEEEHALELRTRDRERKLLKKIEQSIARIDAGDYGYCDETGEPIGVGRLLARPTATLSLEAQQRRELKQKMFGD